MAGRKDVVGSRRGLVGLGEEIEAAVDATIRFPGPRMGVNTRNELKMRC